MDVGGKGEVAFPGGVDKRLARYHLISSRKKCRTADVALEHDDG
jgi:hypothetical protein